MTSPVISFVLGCQSLTSEFTLQLQCYFYGKKYDLLYNDSLYAYYQGRKVEKAINSPLKLNPPIFSLSPPYSLLPAMAQPWVQLNYLKKDLSQPILSEKSLWTGFQFSITFILGSSV